MQPTHGSSTEIHTEIETEIHPKHRFSPIEKNGLSVPETEIHLDDSPTGPNEPFRVYRTRGPECDVTVGLPALRAEWIEGRGDVEKYEGRPRNLADDGKTATRRGEIGRAHV